MTLNKQIDDGLIQVVPFDYLELISIKGYPVTGKMNINNNNSKSIIFRILLPNSKRIKVNEKCGNVGAGDSKTIIITINTSNIITDYDFFKRNFEVVIQILENNEKDFNKIENLFKSNKKLNSQLEKWKEDSKTVLRFPIPMDFNTCPLPRDSKISVESIIEKKETTESDKCKPRKDSKPKLNFEYGKFWQKNERSRKEFSYYSDHVEVPVTVDERYSQILQRRYKGLLFSSEEKESETKFNVRSKCSTVSSRKSMESKDDKKIIKVKKISLKSKKNKDQKLDSVLDGIISKLKNTNDSVNAKDTTSAKDSVIIPKREYLQYAQCHRGIRKYSAGSQGRDESLSRSSSTDSRRRSSSSMSSKRKNSSSMGIRKRSSSMDWLHNSYDDKYDDGVLISNFFFNKPELLRQKLLKYQEIKPLKREKELIQSGDQDLVKKCKLKRKLSDALLELITFKYKMKEYMENDKEIKYFTTANGFEENKALPQSALFNFLKTDKGASLTINTDAFSNISASHLLSTVNNSMRFVDDSAANDEMPKQGHYAYIEAKMDRLNMGYQYMTKTLKFNPMVTKPITLTRDYEYTPPGLDFKPNMIKCNEDECDIFKVNCDYYHKMPTLKGYEDSKYTSKIGGFTIKMKKSSQQSSLYTAEQNVSATNRQ